MKLRTTRATTLLAFFTLTGLVLAQPETTFLLEVKGLTCPFCTYGLEKKLKKVKGVEWVSLDLEKDLATVTARPGVLVKEADLRKAVRKAGFQLASLKKVPSGASPEPGTP